MNESSMRAIGYGGGAAVLAGLVYIGWVHKTEADAMTLLSSANVQLSLAQNFPEEGKDGAPNAARTKMIREVEDLIRRARRQDPGLHAGIELEAHLSWTTGEYRRAAELFQEAQSSADATPESSVIDRLNEARMWRAADDPERALAILEQLSGFLVNHAMAAQVQQARVLLELKRPAEAVAIARRVAYSCADIGLLMNVGRLLESQNETAVAEVAYRAAAVKLPLANYHLARLKIRKSEFDTGKDLLRQAVAADARQVGIMLEHDAELWKAVRDDERFKDLIITASAAAPGR